MSWDVLSDSRNDMKHIDATSTIHQGYTISTVMTVCCCRLTFIYLHIYLAIYVSIYLSIYLLVCLCIYRSWKANLGDPVWNRFLRPCRDAAILQGWDHSHGKSLRHVDLPGVATWPGEMWGTEGHDDCDKMRVAVFFFVWNLPGIQKCSMLPILYRCCGRLVDGWFGIGRIGLSRAVVSRAFSHATLSPGGIYRGSSLLSTACRPMASRCVAPSTAARAEEMLACCCWGTPIRGLCLQTVQVSVQMVKMLSCPEKTFTW